MTTMNDYGQPVGDPLPDWRPPVYPHVGVLQGRYCRLERLDSDQHAEELFTAYSQASDARDWTYLPVGPFDSSEAYRRWVAEAATSHDQLHYAILDSRTGRAVGTLALLRVNPEQGSIEVGFIVLAPEIQRTPASTEAQYLLMRHIFELGYRRYEWKCDSLNAGSRKAALRLGFTYEGTFRQAAVYKGRNRDTAWYALLDHDWLQVRAAMEKWLDPSNFDRGGSQLSSLRSS